MKELTVLTPTHNRAKLLNKCYETLCKQTNKEFIWLIIDDGSIDDTEKVVAKWMTENKIEIKYYKKSNGGKHRAVNYGATFVDTKLTIILDSDDYLITTAIQDIYNLYNLSKNEKNICGFTFLKKYPDESLMGDRFPNNGRYNFIKWRVNGVVTGDQCDVVYSKYLKEYPFSEYDGEKYIGESTLWIKLGQKYDMICENKAIYVAEYLEGGLTKNGRIVRLKSPNGGMEYANLCLIKRSSIKRKIKYAPIYVAYGLLSKKGILEIIKEANTKINVLLAFPVGIYLRKKWRREYKL